ncbi:hypothetical protein [Alkalihalobacillus trypoxylicola]|uniref:Phage head-tail adapter protein n=1 Tax=Alkalihalobacillus trypoxylicola TaxID=519424 RepID=A0A161PLT5_9BACI|nr:hypothetical protein [Alkalihalobacillus trypoxylicola]KYG34913.1 hypothetical protein AZF04_00850 [Alkalihalobacillus trypoxylicola]
MRFEQIDFYANVKIDEDVLGNPIYDTVVIGSHDGRFNNWSSEEIALLDREVTRTQRKLMTDAPLDIIKQADFIRVGDDRYSIINDKRDYVRWRILHVREYFT